jgi:hypothetical protein
MTMDHTTEDDSCRAALAHLKARAASLFMLCDHLLTWQHPSEALMEPLWEELDLMDDASLEMQRWRGSEPPILPSDAEPA